MIIRHGDPYSEGEEAYALDEGDEVCCYFCQQENDHRTYKRGEAVLCGAGCAPWDANANYVCMEHLSSRVTIHDVADTKPPSAVRGPS